METTKTLLIVGMALMVGGCGSSPPPAATPAPAAAANPRIAPALTPAPKCAMSTQAANTCRIKSSMGGRDRMICELWVGGSPDQPFVYPYQVNVPTLPDRSMPVIFVWKLLNRGYRFADSGMGPTRPVPAIAEPMASFTDGSTTDDDDGESASGRSERKFRWKFAHPGTANKYTYTLQFQVQDPVDASLWATVACDPTIASSGN